MLPSIRWKAEAKSRFNKWWDNSPPALADWKKRIIEQFILNKLNILSNVNATSKGYENFAAVLFPAICYLSKCSFLASNPLYEKMLFF